MWLERNFLCSEEDVSNCIQTGGGGVLGAFYSSTLIYADSTIYANTTHIAGASTSASKKLIANASASAGRRTDGASASAQMVLALLMSPRGS